MIKTIGYVCLTDPYNDRKDWSGSVYKIREAIELAGFRVIWIPYRINTFFVFVARICRKIEEFTCRGKVIGGVMYQPIAKACARSIDMTLVRQCDCLFFPGGAQIGYFLKTEKPYIFFADSTFILMEDYYWHGLAARIRKSAEELDKRASQKALLNIRSSQWAIDSVIHDYHCLPEKCHILQFGPNIDTKDITPNAPYKNGPLNILFSGVNWERKGGNIAVEAVRLLRNYGIDAHLFIAGPQECPPGIVNCDFVIFIGFLDKNCPQDYKVYIDLYKQSHMLLLPTRAECSGTVFCEASAFGIPSYSYATGGVQNYVINDYNGYAFPMSAQSKDFAKKIYDDFRNDRFSVYHTNALTLHKEKLSWEAWASRFYDILTHTEYNQD